MLIEKRETTAQSRQVDTREILTSDRIAGYFAAAGVLLFASASRSVFLRRAARFFTLSLPLQCPISLSKHASLGIAKLICRIR